MHQLMTLVRKDVQQNSKGMALLAAVAIVLASLLYAFRAGDSATVLGALAGFLLIGAPIILVTWLIGHEKLRGTFRLLRLLPVSGAQIMLSKVVCATAFLALLLLVMAEVVPVLFRTLGIASPHPLPLLTLWWLVCGIATLVSSAVALFLAVNQKIATQIAWIGATAVLFLFSRFADNGGLSSQAGLAQLLAESHLQLWGWVILLLWTALCTRFSGRLFDIRDWNDFDEL